MNITMAGIDYSIAPIDTRQRFSFTKSQQQAIYDTVLDNEQIFGCVILATCNRTEIYLSCSDEFCTDPFMILCKATDADYNAYSDLHFVRNADMAFNHLCLLACGAKSQIWGEDQIITQVKDSVSFAREAQATDSVLEVMFRTAIACGKKIKTELRLNERETSVAHSLLEKLQEYPNVKSVLVIGNGEIGQLVAEILIKNNYQTTMTVRQYKHKTLTLPDGVVGIEYSDRYAHLKDFDAVASATVSPHYTIEKSLLCSLEKIPTLFFDLAVPRDIEKSIDELNNVSLFDIDNLNGDAGNFSHETKLNEIKQYINKARLEFYKWSAYRANNGHKKTRFPFFIEIKKQTALIVGGGKIALRRINTLRKFDFNIVVVAKSALSEISRLAKKGYITLHEREYMQSDLVPAFMVVATTNDRKLNKSIGENAKKSGKLVSIADAADECNFYFPAVIERGNITIAVSGDGKDHHAVSGAAKQLRELYNNEN